MNMMFLGAPRGMRAFFTLLQMLIIREKHLTVVTPLYSIQYDFTLKF